MGLLQTDGHCTKYRIRLELSDCDIDLLNKLDGLIPTSTSVTRRTRETNYSKDHSSACLNIYNKDFIAHLVSCGLPLGSKAGVIAEPTFDYSVPDYIRGLIDGDGSVGINSSDRPFVSFVTKSKECAYYVVDTLRKEIGHEQKYPEPTTRDGLYCITLGNLAAQDFVKFAYYDGCLGLDRKIEKAKLISDWTPPHGRFGHKRRPWSDEENKIVLTLSPKKAAEKLNDRSVGSIKVQKYRLLKG